MKMTTEEKFMRAAIKEAQKAEAKDEVPIGCVIVKDGKIISRGHNLREVKNNALAHAEIVAINKACRKLNSWRLVGCDIYVTLEPCPMCSGAIYQSRQNRIIYGAKDPKGGALGSSYNLFEMKGLNHHPEVLGGVLEKECSEILSNYFKKKRTKQKKDNESK